MTKRETRVINAFINCVKTGEYSLDYAILLIEDNARYGWLSEEAKEDFYEAVEPEEDPEEEDTHEEPGGVGPDDEDDEDEEPEESLSE